MFQSTYLIIYVKALDEVGGLVHTTTCSKLFQRLQGLGGRFREPIRTNQAKCLLCCQSVYTSIPEE